MVPCPQAEPADQWAMMNDLRLPRDVREITPSWLTHALATNRELGGPSVTGFSVEALGGGTGFINRLFRRRLRYDQDHPGLPETVIAKFPSADPNLRTVFDRLEQNRREVWFYREFADSPCIATPRLYHGGVDPASGDTVLLLEDMAHARQGDSVVGCSPDEARLCMEQLARFQASWWDNPLLDRLPWMPLKEAKGTPYRGIYPGAWQALQEKSGDSMSSHLREPRDRLASEIHRIKARLSRPSRTVIHGDYRLDNCFFPPNLGLQGSGGLGLGVLC